MKVKNVDELLKLTDQWNDVLFRECSCGNTRKAFVIDPDNDLIGVGYFTENCAQCGAEL
jgi:hypothetical protein